MANELKSMLPEGGSDLIAVIDAAAYIQTSKSEKEEINYVDSNMEANSTEEVVYDLGMPNNEASSNAPTYFLIYLNQYMFQGNEQDLVELIAIVHSCIDNPDINVVLAHERNESKGGCNFDVFFDKAPEELINPPYSLFKDIAIPLHSNEEYRDVGLRQILCKMGAKETDLSIVHKSMRIVKRSIGSLRSLVARNNSNRMDQTGI